MLGYFLLFSGGVWITYGLTLILLGFVSMLWVLIDWAGGVHMGPDPELPTPEICRVGAETHVWSAPANWAPYVDAFTVEMHAVESAVIDISDTVEIKPADPLAETTPTEVIDYSTPLFNTIRRPAPLHLESFTVGWSTERIERIKEMKP